MNDSWFFVPSLLSTESERRVESEKIYGLKDFYLSSIKRNVSFYADASEGVSCERRREDEHVSESP